MKNQELTKIIKQSKKTKGLYCKNDQLVMSDGKNQFGFAPSWLKESSQSKKVKMHFWFVHSFPAFSVCGLF